MPDVSLSDFDLNFPIPPGMRRSKIEHILQHEKLLEDFSRNGCLFITTAVESVEDEVLEKLDKGHTAQDFRQALRLLRRLGITMIPTFVPFTPWTTLNGYRRLLREIVDLQLVNSVPPVQLSIRLLLPQGSPLLNADDVDAWLGEFNPKMLGYTWTHPDPRVDELQKAIQDWAMTVENQNLERQKSIQGNLVYRTSRCQDINARTDSISRTQGASNVRTVVLLCRTHRKSKAAYGCCAIRHLIESNGSDVCLNQPLSIRAMRSPFNRFRAC